MVEFGKADLTSCDKEPIHIPGSIQPHGCLFSCDRDTFMLRRVSANAAGMLGLEHMRPGDVLSELLGREAVHEIRNALTNSLSLKRPAYLFDVEITPGHVLDLSIHIVGPEVVVECEATGASDISRLSIGQLRLMLDRIRNLSDQQQLCDTVVRLLRGMLRYDRIMIYRFDPDWSGKVIAEARSPLLESFLGQHFPSSDIPAQARDLYRRALIRTIGDVNYTPVPLLELPGSAPLDMSFAQLRSVSPIHCEYLANMGVGASMSISLIVDGALWGMIACHNYSPRRLTLAERAVAKMFGEFVALRIVVILRTNRLLITQRTHALIDNFLRDAVSMTDMPSYLRSRIADLQPLVPCDGLGLWIGGQWTAYKEAPTSSQVAQKLVETISPVVGAHIWHTAHFSGAFEWAKCLLPNVAGVMVIPISAQPEDYLFLFRKEIVQTLNWGGDPNKTYKTGPNGPRLTPRSSFAIWKEQVRDHCYPWTTDDEEAAILLRSALIEVMGAYHQQQLQERSEADIRQRMLNEELSHRVKNILAVVQSLMSRPVPQGRTMKDHFSILKARIGALARAHDQVVRADGGGLLRQLLEAELEPYRLEASTITLHGPEIWLTGRALSVIALVIHELATNAAKYGSLSCREGRLEVDWHFDEREQTWVLTWKETGGPPVTQSDEKGFGSVLIERAIPHELNGKAICDLRTEGLFIRFELPKRHAVCVMQENNIMSDVVIPSETRSTDDALRMASVLIVEDQLLIAMDIEHALMEHGVKNVRTVSSVYEGQQALQKDMPDIALLDLNLGDETSVKIANALRDRHVPFLFATGYADGSMIPPEFNNVPVIRKPYAVHTVIREMTKLLVSSAAHHQDME
ncbi:HWE histidine kinase domain-containing protein [Acetobacter tropicalis]|uniref:histidine kinase n=1 Tax=Acetobacter tropicalis NBRC 101654 TaxID=749388 RepID=F7VE10_9PROT|nr:MULTISPECIES: HWE histidine kinase domain-containing protein [Acetobacter]MCG4253190.1 GAF domain-containing protein [Acetobacter senegalensis]GAA08605.1 bacteriophytochrome protein [Acetobacter tropicalis NBRC 101654]